MNTFRPYCVRALCVLCLISASALFSSALPMEREVVYYVSGIAGTQKYTRLEKIDPLADALNEAKEKAEKSKKSEEEKEEADEKEKSDKNNAWKSLSLPGTAVILIFLDIIRTPVCF